MNADKKIEEILEEEGVYVSTTSGVSMEPMLRDRRDTIVVSPVSERLRKYDVALYKRHDGYVLHRVVRVLPDSYVICGDNCVALEKGITDGQILGRLDHFYRKGKKISLDSLSYRVYCRYIVWTYYPRVAFRRAKAAAVAVFRKVFGRKRRL